MQITVQVAGIKAVTRSYRVNRRNRESLFVNPLMIMIQRRTCFTVFYDELAD